MNSRERDSYERAWTRYLRWHTLSFLFLLGFMPFMATVVVLVPDAWGPKAVLVPFLMWGLAWVGATNKALGLICPRCGKEFFDSKRRIRLPMTFIKKCQFCGLRKYQHAPTLPADSASRITE